MKNQILFALSFCLVSTVSFGQELVRFYNTTTYLYGYKDPSKGWKAELKPAIKARYTEAEADAFKDGNIAIVTINPKGVACCDKERYGVIDRTGAEIVPIEHKAIYRHKNSGYILLRKDDDKRGLMYKDGKIIFPAEYQVMTLIGNDNWTANTQPTMLMFGKDYKYGLMQLATGKMTAMHFEQIITHDYRQSYAVKLNGKWAFINNEFEEITPYKYTDMGWSNDNNSFWCEIGGVKKLINATTGKEGSIYTGERPIDYSDETDNRTSNPSTSSNSSTKKDKCTYKCRACNKVAEHSCSSKPGDDCPVLTQKAATSGGGGRKGHEWSKL